MSSQDRRQRSPPDGRLLHHIHHQLRHSTAASSTHRRPIPGHGPAKVPGLSWDDPDLSLLDDRRGELPEFPITVLPEPWQQWATRAAQGAGVAVDHVVVPLLAIVAGQIGAARRIEAVPAWGERLGLWTTLVGFSGSGKTPGLNATKRVLEAVERDRADRLAELRRQHETRVEAAKAAHKRWKDEVAEAVANGATPPPMPPEAEDSGRLRRAAFVCVRHHGREAGRAHQGAPTRRPCDRRRAGRSLLQHGQVLRTVPTVSSGSPPGWAMPMSSSG